MTVSVAIFGALFAAMSFAWAAIFQQEAAQTASNDKALRLSLIMELLRRPKWIAGISLLILGYGLQLVALAYGPVALVQPIVITELAFAVPFALARRRRTAGWREWAGIGGVLVGVCAFLIAASPQSGEPDTSGTSWLIALLPVAIAIAAAVRFGARSTGPVRAMSLAAAAGLAFGVLAVLTKSITYVARAGADQVLTSWQLYAAVVCGIGALVLSQSAYQAGPLAYSMPVVAITEPIMAVMLGATVLGEQIFLSGPVLLVEFFAVLIACTGITLLATSPTVLSIYQEGVRPATHSSEEHGRGEASARLLVSDEDHHVFPPQPGTPQTGARGAAP